jgi:hypothetical protein
MRGFAVGAICILIAVAILVSNLIAAANGGSHELQPVSIVALIGSPDRYNGTRVHVTGYLDLAYEANALYLHEQDFRYGMTKNAIRLTLRRDQQEQFKALSRKYVVVEATFAADESPNGMFSGHLADVTRMQQLLTVEELLRSQSNSLQR